MNLFNPGQKVWWYRGATLGKGVMKGVVVRFDEESGSYLVKGETSPYFNKIVHVNEEHLTLLKQGTE